MAVPASYSKIVGMDEETRAAFGRMDRWFELSQAQHIEFRDEMREAVAGLRTELTAEIARSADELRAEMREGDQALRAELRSFRDWVVSAITELRTQIREILMRLDRLERRNGNPIG
jgi:hypothetical protein